MNDWRYRLMLLAIMLAVPQVHAWGWYFIGVINSDEGMALFHGSAAAVDFLILWCAPRFISGRLCDYTQTLCIVSVVANYVGWIAYTAYAPPIFYNTFMWGLSYVQWAVLLLVDRHADATGIYLVRGHFSGRYSQNFGKAYL